MSPAPSPPDLADPAGVPPLDESPVGLGGRIRVRWEDFGVEEIPLARPLGRGDHLHFLIEKRGISTFDALLRLSKRGKVSEHIIGYAGLKDARAVTSQMMSVRRGRPERFLEIHEKNLRVLTAAWHPRPLKIGHHRGNRFTIRIRGVDAERIPAARRALEHMSKHGMPNAYGGQRFGTRADGHRIGKAVIDRDWPAFLQHLLGAPLPVEGDERVVAAREAYDAGDLETAVRLFPMKHRMEKKAISTLLRGGTPQDAFEALGRRPRRIWVAAWQSFVFNRVLAARMEEGTWGRVLPGDIAADVASGALYPAREHDLGETGSAPTGPLVGDGLVLADGAPGRLERAVLTRLGADPEALAAEHVHTRGLRRPLRIPVREASLEVESPEDVVVRFVLPPGSFATVLLERLMA